MSMATEVNISMLEDAASASWALGSGREYSRERNRDSPDRSGSRGRGRGALIHLRLREGQESWKYYLERVLLTAEH